MKAVKKMSVLLGTTALLAGTTVFSPPQGPRPGSDNDFTRKLREKIRLYTGHMPEDRVFVTTDRPFYFPGEQVWFTAWVRDGESLTPSKKSEVLNVELLAPNGSVVKTLNMLIRQGTGAGNFAIAGDAPGGQYKLRARTSWMRNEGEERYFEKALTVQEVIVPSVHMKLDFTRKAYGAGDEVIAGIQLISGENTPLGMQELRYNLDIAGITYTSGIARTDKKGEASIRVKLPRRLEKNDALLNVVTEHNGSTESISRAVPLVLNNLSLHFYPEGGDLVAGVENRVAFRARNEYGKAADIEAELCDAEGRVISRLVSFHMGMGAFTFTPSAGQHYYVRLIKPSGITEKFDLMEPLDKGYALRVEKENELIAVAVKGPESREMALVAQMRGKVLYTTTFPHVSEVSQVRFSAEEFPMGVLQLTLFDHKGIARAERLVFVNRDQKLNITVRSDKEKYQPREKVRLDIHVRDHEGFPASALLSLAVVNNQLLSFADDRSHNLLSSMFLQDDIREVVEEPQFYFSSDSRAESALDLLMLTAGWRRFTWEKVMQEDLPEIKFQGKRMIIAGTVIDGTTGKPVPHALLTDGKTEWRSDTTGRFVIRGRELYDPLSLSVRKPGFMQSNQQVYDYNEDIQVYLYPQNYRWFYERAIPSSAVAKMEMAPVRAAVKDDASEVKKKVNVLPKIVAKPRLVKVQPNEPAMERKAFIAAGAVPPGNRGVGIYERVREFESPRYEKTEEIINRNDFRNTVYWNPRVEVGRNGRTSVEFYLSDDIASFKAYAEGFSIQGRCGDGETKFHTQLPFQIITKIPALLNGGDIAMLQVTLKNNTNKPLGGKLELQLPPALELLNEIKSVQTIMPGAFRQVALKCRVMQTIADTSLTVSFKACELEDQVQCRVRIRPRGFPQNISFSGQSADRSYEFLLKDVVENSLEVSVNAFPDVLSDIMQGVEGILAEPYGCFEQTSCTAYPNAMALMYMQTTGSADATALARATDLLDRGYKRLTTFETKTRGYEWFGASPAHEGLTAYGIMEFSDMKRAGQSIDEKMMQRTAQWLLSHRDGKGGFAREQRALHDFGRISDAVMNAYIVYALSDAGYREIRNEYQASKKLAIQSGDAYLLALMANAAASMNEKNDYRELLRQLLQKQSSDGSITGSSHSITYSQGKSLAIETTALAVLAMLAGEEKDHVALERCVKFLLQSRGGSGTFGSSQATVLALKALTSFASYNKRTRESGEIEVYVDGRKVAARKYEAGEKGVIRIADLAKNIKGEGSHKIRVRYVGTQNPLPYSVSVNYHSFMPVSNDSCAVDLVVKAASEKIELGQTLRLAVQLQNKKQQGLPNVMAVIGIPAGLEVQPWQLKQMQENKLFDYYEVTGDKLMLYYRGLAPGDKKEINVDLKAGLAGTFFIPASSAYLYYTNEYKTWSGGGVIEVSENKQG